jgi:hypothetical protein
MNVRSPKMLDAALSHLGLTAAVILMGFCQRVSVWLLLLAPAMHGPQGPEEPFLCLHRIHAKFESSI